MGAIYRAPRLHVERSTHASMNAQHGPLNLQGCRPRLQLWLRVGGTPPCRRQLGASEAVLADVAGGWHMWGCPLPVKPSLGSCCRLHAHAATTTALPLLTSLVVIAAGEGEHVSHASVSMNSLPPDP